MHLIQATDDFCLAGRPMPGFPIVLHEDMQSCVEANSFLRYYLRRGAIGSSKSWEPTGRALYDYFSFLEAHGLSWTDVDRGEDKTLLAAYRDYCLEHAELARTTVRQRLAYICEFYNYAKRQGWVDRLPYEYEDRSVARHGGFLEHVETHGGRQSVRSVMPKTEAKLPKFLTKEQVERFIGGIVNPHHLMIARLAIQSGLRREELATFPASYVFNPQGVSTRNVTVRLDPADGIKTKGSRARDIVISRRLMQNLHRYVAQIRGERASLSGAPQACLFLNQDGLPFAAGGKGLEREFAKAGKRVGIKVHPHMLRHTYATHTLVALQRQPGERRVEPLVFIKNQLGHARISTTMVYLHLVNEYADDAVLAYDDELNDWFDGGIEGGSA